jgi:hypothetical protein
MIEGKKHLILVLATIHFLTIVVHKLLSKFIDLSTTNLSINSIIFCFIDLSTPSNGKSVALVLQKS